MFSQHLIAQFLINSSKMMSLIKSEIFLIEIFYRFLGNYASSSMDFHKRLNPSTLFAFSSTF